MKIQIDNEWHDITEKDFSFGLMYKGNCISTLNVPTEGIKEMFKAMGMTESTSVSMTTNIKFIHPPEENNNV
jgi:hypothetical protein